MSNLIGNLIGASKALQAHQTGVATAGKNLANVNNPDYARQRVVLGDRFVAETAQGPVSSGVEALSIRQIRDQFLDVAVVREKSLSGELVAQQSILERAEANLGEAINRSEDSAAASDQSHSRAGISNSINDFFNGFDDVAASPLDVGAKQVLLQKADILANKFNVTDQRLSDLQADITTQIGTDVTSVNTLLQQIGDYNGAIQTQELGAPGVAIDLRDQRQAKLEQLAKYINFTSPAIAGSNGQIQIVVKDSAGVDVVLVNRTSVLGGVSFTGTGFTGGSAGVALGPASGSLKGQLDTRDTEVQDLRDNLKLAADQISASINTAYGSSFFTVPPTTGLMELNAAVTVSNFDTSSTADLGANDRVLAMANVAQQVFSIAGGNTFDGTIGAFYAKTVSGLGQSLAGVNDRLIDQTNVETMIATQRNAVSSVSMDEEMTDLIKFQRSYQASAKVISVLDQMLDGIVNGLIR